MTFIKLLQEYRVDARVSIRYEIFGEAEIEGVIDALENGIEIIGEDL
jgi:hypothetical protein